MQPSKLALLSVAVSSAMALSACSNGLNSSKDYQKKIEPTQNVIQASVEQYVKQMTNEEVKQIQSVNLEDKNTVVLTTDTKLFESYSVGDIVALPPSDSLLIGYTGKIESKTNQAGKIVVKMRMATIPEVFKKLDFTFNSANPDTKVVGVITPPNATGTVNLSRQNANNTNLQTGLSFGTELKKEDGKFGGEINLEYAIKDDIKMKIIGSISDLQVIEELKYYPDERQCTGQGSTMDSCKSNHILATDYKVVSSEVMGKINVKVEFEGGKSINNPIKIQDVWKDLSKGKKYLNLTGLDESDKQGLIPLAGIVLNGTVTGFVGEPLDSIKKITQAGGAIVWLYLNRQGEIVSYKGTITPINLEKSFYQKTTLTPDAKKNELVGTPSIDRNSNTSLKSAIKGSIEMNQTLGVTLAADLFVGGIRPFTAQLSPLLSNLNVKLNGDYTYDWLLGKPTGQYGCINATNKIFGNVLVKAGLGVKVGNWKSIGGIYQYSNDWIYKEDKLLNSCYTAGKPDFTVTNKGDDPKNPNNVLYEIDITNAFNGMEGILNEMNDNDDKVDWSLQVNAPKRIFSDYGTYNPKSKKFTSTQYTPQIISSKVMASLPKGVEATFHFETNAQDFSGKPVVTQKKLLVKSQPTVTAISPLSASINVPVTFKVTGTGLPKTAILAIDDAICEQPKNHTATGFEQVCTLKGNNPNRKVTIKTDTQANKGVVINDKLSITLGYPIRPVKMTATGITFCSNSSDDGLNCANLEDNWQDLMQDGEVQAGQKMSYELRQYNNETCVIDKVTGLTWEQKTDDGGLRDKDNTYTWYNPDNPTNGGHAGEQNNGKNTHEYIKQLNASNYCGYSDWRLPTLDELYSIVNYNNRPAINFITMFPNTQTSYYWSSSPIAYHNYGVWGVNFDSGGNESDVKNNHYYVRAVR